MFKRKFRLKRDDTFLVSYPRSGNTWLRFMLTYCHPGVNEDPDKRNLHVVIPNLDQNPDPAKTPKPRIIKSHSMYDPRMHRVVYLVRDGRDSVLSFYEFSKREFDYDGSFSEFLANPQFGLHWGEHVESWLENTEESDFLLVKYENMLQDCRSELERVLGFLGWQVGNSIIEDAITEASIVQMKKREKSGQFLAHVGHGLKGRWVERFTQEEIDQFLRGSEVQLRRFGYL